MSVRLLNPSEAASALGIGRTTVFRLMADGSLPSVKIGRLRRVPAQAVDAYIARLGFRPDELPDLDAS